MALVSSNSLLTAYLNIEGLSIMLYVLAGAARTHGSSESGLKYYGAGAAISAILLFGVALVYHGAHSFELAEIATVLWERLWNRCPCSWSSSSRSRSADETSRSAWSRLGA